MLKLSLEMIVHDTCIHCCQNICYSAFCSSHCRSLAENLQMTDLQSASLLLICDCWLVLLMTFYLLSVPAVLEMLTRSEQNIQAFVCTSNMDFALLMTSHWPLTRYNNSLLVTDIQRRFCLHRLVLQFAVSMNLAQVHPTAGNYC